ncbi:MAG: hypothetical protein QW587_04850 [Candidatus Bathyarchaeia archaeon]
MKIVVLEVGRAIAADVEAQLGRPERVISYPRAVTEPEYAGIVREAYKAIAEAGRGGEEVGLVLSGPVALNFQLGQAVGLGHWKVVPYQFSAGRYRPVPPVTREAVA